MVSADPRNDDSEQGEAAPASPQVHPLLAGLAGLLGSKPAPAAKQQPKSAGAQKPAGARPAGTKPASAAAAPAKSAAAPGAPPTGPLVTIVTRNEFYRDGFRNLIKVALAEAVIIIGLIITLVVHLNNAKPEDRYFATTADGRIMQLVPLDQPNMTPAALLSWVAQATSEVMTFGYHDYQRRLQQSSRHFTKAGWETFTTALQKAHIIDSVQAQQQVVTAVPISAPILLQQGVLNGKYRWVMQMPIQVTYKSSTASRVDKLTLNLVVERVPSLENPNGVGIAQWVAQERP